MTVKAKVMKNGEVEERTFEETFYISVIGGNSGLATKNLVIGNVNAPAQVESETDFTLSFTAINLKNNFFAYYLHFEKIYGKI